VLQALSDLKHPNLAAQLRLAANAISSGHHHDLPRWLQDGLVKHALRILRALPTLHLGCDEATDTCAAAAAVLCYVVQLARHEKVVLPGAATLESLTAQLASADVVSAVVQFGMLSPAALTPLPPGHLGHVCDLLPEAFDASGQTRTHSEHFWTPLRVGGYFLAHVLASYTVNYAVCTHSAATKINAVLALLLRTDVFRHLLLTALEEASSELPVARATTSLQAIR
jgi:hypothetical protein